MTWFLLYLQNKLEKKISGQENVSLLPFQNYLLCSLSSDFLKEKIKHTHKKHVLCLLEIPGCFRVA